jgi:ribose 5-phosphate isomerase B
MTIAIGNDHAGTAYKNAILEALENQGFSTVNYGTNDEKSVDYPDFVHPVAQSVANNKSNFGILICGSGNGVSMTANKYPNVRAALCWNTEIAQLARSHNNANILSLPARFTNIKESLDIVKTFLSTEFEGGRHERRVEKINIA